MLPGLLVILCAGAGLLLFVARRRRRSEPAAELATVTPDPSSPAHAANTAPNVGVAAAAAVVTATGTRVAPRPHSSPLPAAPRATAPPATVPLAASVSQADEEPSTLLTDDEPLPTVRADEANMPRWRRPSLKAARFASERVPNAPAPNLVFAAAAATDVERRLVRYDLVRLGDAPDEVKSREVGQLQANDQVEVLERRGNWLRVRTPVGVEGWLHRTTLGDVVGPAAAAPPDVTADAADGSTLDALLRDRSAAAAATTLPAQGDAPSKRQKPRRQASRRSSPAAG